MSTDHPSKVLSGRWKRHSISCSPPQRATAHALPLPFFNLARQSLYSDRLYGQIEPEGVAQHPPIDLAFKRQFAQQLQNQIAIKSPEISYREQFASIRPKDVVHAHWARLLETSCITKLLASFFLQAMGQWLPAGEEAESQEQMPQGKAEGEEPDVVEQKKQEQRMEQIPEQEQAAAVMVEEMAQPSFESSEEVEEVGLGELVEEELKVETQVSSPEAPPEVPTEVASPEAVSPEAGPIEVAPPEAVSPEAEPPEAVKAEPPEAASPEAVPQEVGPSELMQLAQQLEESSFYSLTPEEIDQMQQDFLKRYAQGELTEEEQALVAELERQLPPKGDFSMQAKNPDILKTHSLHIIPTQKTE